MSIVSSNHLALWAGLTALFGNLAAVHVIALFSNGDSERSKATGAVITAICVGASVYAKQKWDDAKEARKRG